MLVELDVPREREAAFRAMFEENGIEIQSYRVEGPGGGNPCFSLLVDSKEAMLALTNLYWG